MIINSWKNGSLIPSVGSQVVGHSPHVVLDVVTSDDVPHHNLFPKSSAVHSEKVVPLYLNGNTHAFPVVVVHLPPI